MVSATIGKTMYVVDYGEVYTNFQMPTPFYIMGKWTCRSCQYPFRSVSL